LKTVAETAVAGSETTVESNVVVQLKYDFAVQCNNIPTNEDYAKSFADSLGVDVSKVVVTTVTQGCRRLLANGERHLQETPAQTVTSDVTYAEEETTEATAAATTTSNTEFAETLAQKIGETSGITVPPPTENTKPVVAIKEVMVVTPPVGEPVPEPIQETVIQAEIPDAAVQVVTATPTGTPTAAPPTGAPTWGPTYAPIPPPTAEPESDVSLAKGRPRTGAAVCLVAALALVAAFLA
jgi:hypothetical protein